MIRIALIAACFLPGIAFAQVIDTNRPGFSYSPNVIEAGTWQLETGLSYEYINSNNDAVSFPQAELRLGLRDEIEVYIASLGWIDTDVGSGFVDPVIGAKVGISDYSAPVISALLFQVSVPVGDNDVSTDSWDPSLAFAWAMSGGIGLAGTVKVSRFDGDYQFDNGLKLPFAINDWQSAFVEWEVNVPEHGGTSHWLNAGFQWLLSDSMQVDFNAGTGFDERGGDYRFGVGFSINP